MKVTLDTNFLVSATQWSYSVCSKLLISFRERDERIFTTNKILEEFAEVLARDFGRSFDEIELTIAKLIEYIEVIEPTIKIEVVKGDPDDNKILECAVASESDYILTYDKHLLELEEFNKIKIIKPEKLINTI